MEVKLPFETKGSGADYSAPSEVKKSFLSPDELEKYRNMPGPGGKPSPIFSMAEKRFIFACPNLNRKWQEYAVEKVKLLWADDLPVDDIAEIMKRETIEVIVLIYHLAEQDQILSREGGLLGRDHGKRELRLAG